MVPTPISHPTFHYSILSPAFRVGVTVDSIALSIEPEIFLHGNQEPHISIVLNVVLNSSGQTVREASAKFYLEGCTSANKQRTLTDAAIVTESATDGKSEKWLKFKFTSALVSGVDNIPVTWPQRFHAALNELKSYRQDGTMMIKLPSNDPQYLRHIQSKVDEYASHAQGQTMRDFRVPTRKQVDAALANHDDNELFVEIMSGGLKLVTEWANMEELHKSSLEVAQMPAVNSFSSLEEARAKLTHGRFLEHQWEADIVERLSGGTEVAFVMLDPKVILALVRYKDKSKLLDSINLNERMNIEITSMTTVTVNSAGKEVDAAKFGYPTTTEQRPFTVPGMLAANRIDIEADFCVMLKKRPKAVYREATAYDENMMTLTWKDATVKIVENEKQAQKEVDAINTLCSGGSQHRRFQPAFLAENFDSAPRQNWLRDIVGCTQQQIDQNINIVINKMASMGKPLNPEQESIVRNVQYSHNYFELIRGPPGCGKTTLMSAITELIVRCSRRVGVIMCAPSNGNTQRVYEARRDLDFKEPRIPGGGGHPQRVYRIGTEEEYLLSKKDTIGVEEALQEEQKNAATINNNSQAPSADATWYTRVAEADKKRECNDPATGITAEAIQWVENMPSLNIEGQVGRSTRNVVPVFRNYLEKLKQGPFSKWKPQDKTAFKHVWRIICQHIIGYKQVICCTVGNMTSRLMKDVLLRYRYGVIMIDEASLTTDPALWNAVVNLISYNRIMGEFGGETSIIKVILIGDEAQGYPLVKSETEPFNYFGPQLARSPYERLVMAGAPVQEMGEQFRMVPAICRFANRRWYGGRLRCSEERQNHRLTADKKVAIVNHFNIDFDTVAEVKHATDRATAEDAFCRVLLADVPDGQCQVEQHTQSRFNMGNVDVIVRLFRKLMYKRLASSPNEIVILTFYNAQRRRLLNALLDLAEELSLKDSGFEQCLHTVDSYQGGEADYIILDTTVCAYNGEGTLGHVGNERKACVASTRARDGWFIVGNLKILDSPHLKHAEHLPFVVDLLADCKKRGACKTFDTDARPEALVGGRMDTDIFEQKVGGGEEAGGLGAGLGLTTEQMARLSLRDPKSAAVVAQTNWW